MMPFGISLSVEGVDESDDSPLDVIVTDGAMRFIGSAAMLEDKAVSSSRRTIGAGSNGIPSPEGRGRAPSK